MLELSRSMIQGGYDSWRRAFAVFPAHNWTILEVNRRITEESDHVQRLSFPSFPKTLAIGKSGESSVSEGVSPQLIGN
jgi:hypothetical protein